MREVLNKLSQNRFLHAFMRQVFPPECLYCKTLHDQLGVYLCHNCLRSLEPLTPRAVIEGISTPILITFGRQGVPITLIKQLKRTPDPSLAQLLAAYMAIQYTQSDYPLPDLITAVPTSLMRKWHLGDNPAELLAKEVAILLDKPFTRLLTRQGPLIRQDLLPLEERRELSLNTFKWRGKSLLQPQRVLLIDDTMTTGATLRCCAYPLEQEGCGVVKMVCVDQGYLKC
ncbi:MAG: hypothetical protein QRY72_00080 [Candidatus Rhabdochlamydia sp.]